MSEDALSYAREVWAACATLGFDSADVRRLKDGLDSAVSEASPEAIEEVLALATQVQQASIAWATDRKPG